MTVAPLDLQEAAPAARPKSARKILLVESYPQVLYGQQLTLLAILDELVAAGVQPVVAVPAEGPMVEAVRARGVEVAAIPYPRLLASYGGILYRYRGWTRLRMYGQWFGYVRQLRRRLKRRRMDCVFCNDLRGLLTVGVAARSLGIPVMIWDKLDRPHPGLDYWELPLAQVTATISRAVQGKFPRWQRRLFARRIQVVSEGVDVAVLDAAPSIREELKIAEDEIAIGIVGSITPRKGQDRLLRLLPRLVAEVPNVVVLVVGEPSANEADRQYAEALPHRHHPQVRFLGMRDDVPSIMRSLDLLVVPSRQEGLGMVLLEAMAARKPVVAARAGGIPEVVIPAETGLLFEGDNGEELLQALLRLCRSAALRRRLGEAGRRRVETHYNRRAAMGKMVTLLVELTESAGTSWQA